MSDQEQTTDEDARAAPEAITFAEFLQGTPPGATCKIENMVERSPRYDQSSYALVVPEIQLHCSNTNCNGIRFFRRISAGGERGTIYVGSSFSYRYITFQCGNCCENQKVYSLALRCDAGDNELDLSSGDAYKFGEWPAYGPPVPSRLISLIAPDRELFLKGRRSENLGLGIGAFGYYRRVVENQKNRILNDVIKVAEMLQAPTESINSLKTARAETQFRKAIEALKDAMPQSLLIRGHNPFTLLHSALSDGLHSREDAKCLSLARYIRIVLVELSERLGQALADQRELNEAVSQLLKTSGHDSDEESCA